MSKDTNNLIIRNKKKLTIKNGKENGMAKFYGNVKVKNIHKNRQLERRHHYNNIHHRIIHFLGRFVRSNKVLVISAMLQDGIVENETF